MTFLPYYFISDSNIPTHLWIHNDSMCIRFGGIRNTKTWSKSNQHDYYLLWLLYHYYLLWLLYSVLTSLLLLEVSFLDTWGVRGCLYHFRVLSSI